MNTRYTASPICKTEIPDGSEIEKIINGAYYHDTYQASIAKDEKTALGIYLNMVNSTPEWVNWLMHLRNKTASAIGLKDLGHLGELDHSKPATDYQVGDRVGIFSVHFISEKEVILCESDKHLSVKLSVCKSDKETAGKVSISTVVHIHNTLGRLYMVFVIPFHKLIAPAMLKRIEAR